MEMTTSGNINIGGLTNDGIGGVDFQLVVIEGVVSHGLLDYMLVVVIDPVHCSLLMPDITQDGIEKTATSQNNVSLII
jgi:hypothetical protein